MMNGLPFASNQQIYIKLLPHLEQFARPLVPAGTPWQESVFADISENGSCLTIEPLPDGQQGPRWGLCGDLFYCEAIRDRTNESSLFVYRIHSARRRELKSVPVKWTGLVRLLKSHGAQLSQLQRSIIPVQSSSSVADLAPTEASSQVDRKVSDLLASALSGVPADLFDLWAPQDRPVIEPSSDELCKALSNLWSRFQLGSHTRIPPRLEAAIKRIVKVDLSASERCQLKEALGVPLLNSAVQKGLPGKLSFSDLLRALPAVPLADESRAAIWSAMLERQEAATLIENLKRATSRLKMYQEGPERDAWATALVALLRKRGSSAEDALLHELVESVVGSDNPLGSLEVWLERFEPPVSLPSTEPVQSKQLDNELLHGEEVVANDISTPRDGTRDTFNTWMLQLQAIENRDLEEISGVIADHARSLIASTTEKLTLDGMQKLVRELNQFAEFIPSYLSKLPDPTRIETDLAAAYKAHALCVSLVGDEFDTVLENGHLHCTPSDLFAAADLYKRTADLSLLPTWVWEVEANDSFLRSYATREADLLSSLLDPEIRDRVTCVLTCLCEEHPTFKQFGALIPDPRVGDGSPMPSSAIDFYVRSWMNRFVNAARGLPENNLQKCAAAPAQFSLDRLETCSAFYYEVKDRLAQQATDMIIDQIVAQGSNEDADNLADEFINSVAFWEENVGTAKDITFEHLSRRVEIHLRERTSKGFERARRHLTMQHNWTNEHGGKVSLRFIPLEGKQWGQVKIPIVLEAKRRHAGRFTVQVDSRSRHRETWPKDWDSPSPGVLDLTHDDWREHPDSPNTFIWTFCLTIPTRHLPETRFECEVKLVDDSTGDFVAGLKLSWEGGILPPQTEIKEPLWSETAIAENVDKHPLGPQWGASEILSRLERGGSVAVTAPRRFGKTTLVDFLAAKVRSSGFAVVSLNALHYYLSGQGMDYGLLWQHISSALQELLGAALVLSPEPLLSEHAFDHVRRAAKSRGLRGIILVFDEAQVFFPGSRSATFAEILKDRLERLWSRDDADLAPITMCFVGLPALLGRTGANLNGLLRPIETYELGERELNRLLLEVTNGALETTKEARLRLARTAGNIYVIRTLVNKLVKFVQTQSRSWVSFDDVLHVERDLRDDLRQGKDRTVSDYIRDILNDAEVVNSWQPSPATPLAIALAEARKTTATSTRLRQEATAILKRYYDAAQNEWTVRLVYDDVAFEDHMHILHERRVFTGADFFSPLYEDWLVGLPAQFSAQAWSELLWLAASKRVRVPALAHEVLRGEGPVATIKTFERDGIRYACRISHLGSPEEREKFLETQAMLDDLVRQIRRGGAGAEYIFELEAFGLSAENETEAVQIYRWIDGADLSRLERSLSAMYVVDLGKKLSLALRFLHSAGIVHRDLRPSNVILTDQGNTPKVIDFGFARRLASEVNTPLDSTYAAPEVRQPSAVWTKAADIYSLGCLLSELVDPNHANADLAALLERMCSDNLELRPDAQSLEGAFNAIGEELRVDQVKRTSWERVRDACEADYRSVPWFRELMDKFQGNFVAAALGCFQTAEARCREGANFLNQVLEGSPPINKERLSLGKVMSPNQSSGSQLATNAMRDVWKLRTKHSHGSASPFHFNYSKTSSGGEALKNSVTEAADQIGRFLKLPTLKVAIGFILNS